MVSKVLKKMEVLRGFIQIPAESESELIGNTPLPCFTMLNSNPARLDKYGRLWSPYLKNRFSIGTVVELNKTENGYHVAPSESKQEGSISEMRQQKEVMLVSPSLESQTTVYWKVLEGDCLEYLNEGSVKNVHLTFFDPPYRQRKYYRFFDDAQPAWRYWGWLKENLHKVYDATVDGGAIYFMQREKNAEQVSKVLRRTGWKFQNLIAWKKKTSAVPCNSRFSKQYQIIAYATKGDKPRVFNKLRVDLPPLPEHKYERENGVYLTDVWDDIRELTSGYFAGDEAIRDSKGNRVHTQQSPVALLLRIILSSTLPGDTVLDPLAGTGTTLVVAYQLERNSIGIEIDPNYVEIIRRRLGFPRPSDDVSRYYDYYRFTPNLREIWKPKRVITEQRRLL
ncbi:MAG: Modification methylase MjaV [Candidatus Bathyarchaeota archaeon BA2]|nr:MAG: Modification methylase MjaV [Candidatus Bathyarchaeota archaeon BA2]